MPDSLSFDAGTYIIVITSQKKVGHFLGFPVFRVMSMKFLSCNEALKQSNSEEARFFFLSFSFGGGFLDFNDGSWLKPSCNIFGRKKMRHTS